MSHGGWGFDPAGGVERTVVFFGPIEPGEYTEADADGSGEIDSEEFIELMSKHIGSQAEVLEGELRYAFDALDVDGSGTVSADELKVASCNLGEKLSNAEVDAMLALVDNDGSGEIDFEEFCACARAETSTRGRPDAPPGIEEGFTTEVLRRKFRSVLRMLVLQRRITDAFSKVNNAAYQWQRFTDIEKLATVSTAIKNPIDAVQETATICATMEALDGHVCMPVISADGSIKGFVDIFDILGRDGDGGGGVGWHFDVECASGPLSRPVTNHTSVSRTAGGFGEC